MAVLAANLATLRLEVYRRWPDHQRRFDGWIGDAKHQQRKSDHNPDSRGVVHAIDIDVNRIDPRVLVRVAISHPTTKYVIFDRTIWSLTRGFRPHQYTGTDPHIKHVHISGRAGTFETDRRGWGLAAGNPGRPVAPIAPRVAAPVLPRTQKSMPGSRQLKVKQPPMHGYDVLFVQRFIGPRQCGEADGFYGAQTAAGVRWYQHMRGLPITGVCDASTFRHMGVKV